MLEAIDITVHKGTRTLLDGVSVALHPGEVLAVVGPNGAGKTTLVRVVSGEWSADRGQVKLDGKLLEEWSRPELAQRRSVLGQETGLAFPFSVFEVALLGRLPHEQHDTRLANERIALEALAVMEVDHLAGRTYTTLSGGERQRVHLARVLAQVWPEAGFGGRRYVLMDEPTASQDLAHQHTLLELARRFAREGAGVLVVLHDLNLAARYADRMVALKDGRLVAEGPPGDVLTPGLIRDVFSFEAQVLSVASGAPLVIPADLAPAADAPSAPGKPVPPVGPSSARSEPGEAL